MQCRQEVAWVHGFVPASFIQSHTWHGISVGPDSVSSQTLTEKYGVTAVGRCMFYVFTHNRKNCVYCVRTPTELVSNWKTHYFFNFFSTNYDFYDIFPGVFSRSLSPSLPFFFFDPEAFPQPTEISTKAKKRHTFPSPTEDKEKERYGKECNQSQNVLTIDNLKGTWKDTPQSKCMNALIRAS